MELFIRCWLLSVSLFCCNVALILVINWSLLLSPMVDTHSGRYPVYCLWVEYRISAGHGFRGLGMLALRARQNPFTLSIHSGYASMDNRLNASCWWLCKRETCHCCLYRRLEAFAICSLYSAQIEGWVWTVECHWATTDEVSSFKNCIQPWFSHFQPRAVFLKLPRSGTERKRAR